MAKEGEWIDQNVDLDQLAKKIDQFFKSEGFESRIENNPSDQLRVIQAKKTGVMRSLVSSRKVMQVVIQGEPNHFTISSGMGEWGKNVAAAALIPVIGWVGLVGLGLNAVFGKKLWNEIKLSVTLLANNHNTPIEENISSISRFRREGKSKTVANNHNTPTSAELDSLFALGEITKEEYTKMRNDLMIGLMVEEKSDNETINILKKSFANNSCLTSADLDSLFALGEITKEEFEEMKLALE